LLEWEEVISGKVKLAISKLKDAGKGGAEVDILRAFSTMTSNVVAELCFGDSFKSSGNADVSLFVQLHSEALLIGQPSYLWEKILNEQLSYKTFRQNCCYPIASLFSVSPSISNFSHHQLFPGFSEALQVLPALRQSAETN
jgi:hypothetical protein